jgi:hypothetical protein
MQWEFHHACIIIDDPLLKENYGYLNYRKLLSLMDRHNFFTTIAFIPWNYNRTDKGIATLFRERADKFSLCVHGCDHTNAEFGKSDFNYLNNKVKLATARMIQHEKRTGIPFDRVMVFPQGIFSNEALEALRTNNYLAAVNTGACPIKGHISSNFPFFLRYKPEGIINWVSGPLFIVLHHDYFKKGYERLANFVSELNAQSKNIRWDSAGDIIRYYLSINEVHSEPVDVDLSELKFQGYKENVKIWLRRHASEFRDNYLSRNDSILNLAERVKDLMKMKG